jgi:hypothetical protein
MNKKIKNSLIIAERTLSVLANVVIVSFGVLGVYALIYKDNKD